MRESRAREILIRDGETDREKRALLHSRERGADTRSTTRAERCRTGPSGSRRSGPTGPVQPRASICRSSTRAQLDTAGQWWQPPLKKGRDLRELEARRLGRAERSGRDRGVGRVERGERRRGRVGRDGGRLGTLGSRDGREPGGVGWYNVSFGKWSLEQVPLERGPRGPRAARPTDDSNPPWAIKSFASSGWVTTSVLG